MATPPTPVPNEQFAAEAVAALKEWANRHNTDAVNAYNEALAAIGSHSTGSAPSVTITAPSMWVVDAALVYAVYTGQDPNYEDLKNVFITIPYVPPPPPPVTIPDVTIQLSLPGPFPGTYEASGDSSAHPIGSETTQGGHTYRKIQAGTEPMGPVYAWQQIS